MILEPKRLILRPFTENDVADAFEYYTTTTGNTKKEFWIKTNAHVNTLRNLISTGATCTNGQTYASQNYYYSPTETITVSSPIATYDKPFSGRFVGYSTRQNVKLSMSNADYASMFGVVQNAYISSLNITGSVTHTSHVASVAGLAKGSTIFNIVNSATIKFY